MMTHLAASAATKGANGTIVPGTPQHGRVCLPERDWPALDRKAWAALFTHGDILDAPGRGRHWAPATRDNHRRHYARWLAWLRSQGFLGENAEPWHRVTPERVQNYLRALLARDLAPFSVASSIVGLKVVLKAMKPDGSWRWLMDLSNRINRWATPRVDRRAALRPAEEIFVGAQAELDRLLATPLTLRSARVAYRDTLIVLLLAGCPIRLGNLAMINLGDHLSQEGGALFLRFAEHETKNRQRLAFELAPEIAPYLAVYLDRIRPSFGAPPSESGLWVASGRRRLSYQSLNLRINLVTERLFAKAINPHSFRTCAATSLVYSAPEKARLAAPLLGHRYFSTTEEHYVKACQITASRDVHAQLTAIRRRAPEKGKR